MAEGTSFDIDINVEAAGVPAASAALSDLSSKLTAGGASSVQFESALARVNAASATAAAAVTSTAAAAAAGQASYDAAEAAADRAAKAVERIGAQLDAQQGKLAKALEAGDASGATRAEAAISKLTAKQQEAQAAAAAASGALAEEAAALDALNASAAGAEANQSALTASSKDLEGGMKDAAAAEQKATDAAAGSGKVNELSEAFGKLGGPVGGAGQKLFSFADGLKKMGGAAGSGAGLVLGLTVAVVAIAAAFIAGVVAVGQWAVGLADANRSAALTTEALSRSKASLKGLGDMMPGIADRTGLTGDALQDMAKQLDGAGVTAKDMPAALEAAAMAEAALGKGGAADLIKDLKEGKKSASALAAEMKTRFGDIVAKKMLSLDGQAAKLKGNLAETFGGLNIEGLLGGLAKMVGLLDANSSSGKAIKWIFESLFQPLIDGAAESFPAIERFFLGVMIGALKIYNSFKPAIRAVKEFAGAGEGTSFDWLAIGESVAVAVAVAFGVMALAVGLALSPFILLGLAIYQLVSIGMEVVAAVESVGDSISAALEDVDLGAIGTAMIDGLVEGILGGLSAVVGAVTSIGAAAVSAAESALEIGSPSKIFRGIGGFTAEGFTEGVEGGTKDATRAMGRMVEPPDGVVPAGGAGGRGGANMAGAVFNLYGVKDAEQAEGRLRTMLAELLSGGSPPPAPVPA